MKLGTPGTVTERLLTTEEVADWFGLRRSTLEKARSTQVGDFPPFVRIGRTVRYRRGDVETWLRCRSFNVDGTAARS